jgi:16S rRNA (cytosine1402-N4)-methyltransferase
VADTSGHRPVLLEEALEALAVQSAGIYLDATLGRGGHAAAILDRLGPQGRLVALDRDPEAVAAGGRRFEGDPRVQVRQGDFAMLAGLAREATSGRGFDGILLDLGVSSPQLDDPGRGFSFRHDGPLDMRMDPCRGPSAAEWLADVDIERLAGVLRELGEERHARRVARAIGRAREQGPIETTERLAEIVAAAVPGRERERHPATRTFQAIRMEINGELEALDRALAAVPEALAPGGRVAVISFHSLEDRRVKRFLKRAAGDRGGPGRDARGKPLPEAPGMQSGPRLRPLGRPVTPGEAECRDNPRARSARLRAAERVA